VANAEILADLEGLPVLVGQGGHVDVATEDGDGLASPHHPAVQHASDDPGLLPIDDADEHVGIDSQQIADP
jgi:hypothetical protein